LVADRSRTHNLQLPAMKNRTSHIADYMNW